MPISQLELLKTRVKSIKVTLERASTKEKGELAGKALAENFNSLIQEIETAYPELRSALPARITAHGPFAHMGASDVSYLDLEVFVDQVLNLLELVHDRA
jgi:hypothetical protein